MLTYFNPICVVAGEETALLQPLPRVFCNSKTDKLYSASCNKTAITCGWYDNTGTTGQFLRSQNDADSSRPCDQAAATSATIMSTFSPTFKDRRTLSCMQVSLQSFSSRRGSSDDT